MATGILIMGPSGAGKTTLGQLVARELDFAFVDIDDYIWRKDTPIPFSVMYPKEQKISRLTEAIAHCDRFVMSGSMNSFHEHFDPCFELVVYLWADPNLRVRRVHQRELEWFGDRITEGGDMYQTHRNMLDGIAGYDLGLGGSTLQQHQQWLSQLACPILRLNGGDSYETNLHHILETYHSL